MKRTVGIGIIGLGSVARKYVPNIRLVDRSGYPAEIRIACDINPEAEKRAEHWGIPEFTANADEVLGRKDIEIVAILTDMQSHGRLAIQALKAGKHVLVEKPMSMDLDEARELMELAAASPTHLVCAPHVTLSRTYQDIWRRVHNGDIGEIHSARGLYGWSGPWWGQWFYQPGGGPMFDLGVYNVTTLTGLLGPAKRVMSMAGTAKTERIVDGLPTKVETEDNSQLLIDFGNTCFAAITTGFTIQKYRCSGIELYGSEGTIQMIGEDWAPQGYEMWRNSHGCWEVFDQPNNWPWSDGIRDLIESVHDNREPVNNPDHAFHVLEVMKKSFESARTGQSLPILSEFEPVRFELLTSEEVAPHLNHAPS